MSFVSILALGALFCFLLMTLSWFISYKLNFYSLVDAVWAYGIGGLAITFALSSDGSLPRKALALIFAVTWSLRLGTHLAFRLRAHYPTEDRRYVELKSKWGPAKFFIFFQFQAFSQLAFSLPFLFLTKDMTSDFSFLIGLGIFIFLIGVYGETVADNQLNKFRKDPSNKGMVCKVGFWKYSRHPNYFFEWLIWCGIAIASLQSPYGYMGLISPFLMYLTLNFLTGVPAAEEQSLKSKGDLYREYQKETSRFFPRIQL